MDDLKNSPFFDKRTVGFLQALLSPWGGRRVPTPISENEKILLRNQELVKTLDGEVDGGLLSLATEVKDYAPVHEAIFFLLASRSRGRLDDGVEALRAVIEEERVVDRKMLKRILKLGEEMPMVFAVALTGEDAEKRHTPPPPKTSSIDVNRFRDFK